MESLSLNNSIFQPCSVASASTNFLMVAKNRMEFENSEQVKREKTLSTIAIKGLLASHEPNHLLRGKIIALSPLA